MPGFGSSPFGDLNFGEWKWSKQVLFDFLPQMYRDADEDSALLEAFMDGLRPSYDGLRLRIREFNSLRDPFKIRTPLSETGLLRLGAVIPERSPIEQTGLDGYVEIGTKYFHAPSARFTSRDIGKELAVVNSSILSNNRTVQIASVVNPTTITTNPVLEVDAGPFLWEVRGIVQSATTRLEIRGGDVSQVAPGWEIYDGSVLFTVAGRKQFRTSERDKRILTEREGVNALVDSVGRVVLSSGNLTQQDVGKRVTLTSSSIPTNNGPVEIQRVVNSTTFYPSFVLLRGLNSTGGVGYSAQGADLGGVIPRVCHVVAGLNTDLSVTVDGADVTVNLATNAFGTPTSTASEVADLVNADANASEIFLATAVTGTGFAAASDFVPVSGRLLSEDVGPLVWAVLPRPIVEIEGISVPKGVVLKEGVDGEVTAGASVSTITGKFEATLSDLGQYLSLSGSLIGNEGVFEIVEIVDTSTYRVDGFLTVDPTEALTWEVRTPSNNAINTQVSYRAPSLLPFFGQDFGWETDELQSELRQRDAVAHIGRWVVQKGHPESYRIVGLLSGFDVTSTQLYRINPTVYGTLPAENVLEYIDGRSGHSGTQGSLNPGVDYASVFSDPTASFTSEDIGRHVHVSGSSGGTNDLILTIAGIVDSTHVGLDPTDAVSLPEANNGSLTWVQSRLYSDQAPLLPAFDHFNPDMLEEYINERYGIGRFRVDKYCWEDDWTTTMDTVIVAVTSLSAQRHQVSVDLGPFPAADISQIILDLGLWKLTDSASSVYFLETVPVVSTLNLGPYGLNGSDSFTANFPSAGFTKLTNVGGSPFVYTDVGKEIRITGATSAGNNGNFVITQFVDANNIVYANASGVTEVAPGSGASYLKVGQVAVFEVDSAAVPSLGAGTIEYVCEETIGGCGYCASRVVRLMIRMGSLAEEGNISTYNSFDRVIDLLEREVKPAHVELITDLGLTLEATISFSGTGAVNVVAIDPLIMEGVGLMTVDARDPYRSGSAALVGIGELDVEPAMTYAAAASLLGEALISVTPSVI